MEKLVLIKACLSLTLSTVENVKHAFGARGIAYFTTSILYQKSIFGFLKMAAGSASEKILDCSHMWGTAKMSVSSACNEELLYFGSGDGGDFICCPFTLKYTQIIELCLAESGI